MASDRSNIIGMDKYDKLIKRGRRTKHQVKANTQNSWLNNAFKSLGYSAKEILTEVMPATLEVGATSVSTIKDLRESIKNNGNPFKAMVNSNQLLKIGKDALTNSLEDLKSGKFYNKERQDHIVGLDEDFGMEDFDMGEDSYEFESDITSDDKSASAIVKKSGNNQNDVTQITMINNIGQDSPIVQATEFQTEVAVKTAKLTAQTMQGSTQLLNKSLITMNKNLGSQIGALNENVSTIASAVAGLGSISTVATKYFEDSMQMLTSINTSLATMTTHVTGGDQKRERKYQNVEDIFGSNGSLDINAYKELVKKQFSNYADNNMVLGQIKNILSQPDTLAYIAANPLSFLPKAVVNKMIPEMAKSALKEFDTQLSETFRTGLARIGGLRRSDNPILSAIGSIFGVDNKLDTHINKGDYDKRGAAKFDGITYKTINEVIPTYLRQITSALTGQEEHGFDYDKGVFRSIRDMQKNFEEDRRYNITKGMNDYRSGMKDYLNSFHFSDGKIKEQWSKSIDKFLEKLITDSSGGRGPNQYKTKDGRIHDDIAELLNVSSDDPTVSFIRSYLTGVLPKSEVTRLFGGARNDARASATKAMRDIQESGVLGNVQYVDYNGTPVNNVTNGFSNNDNLRFGKSGDKRVLGIKSGGTGLSLDQYGKSQHYYLRKILYTMLNFSGSSSGNTGRGRRRKRGGPTPTGPSGYAAKTLAELDAQTNIYEKDKTQYERSTNISNSRSSYTSEELAALRDKDKNIYDDSVGKTYDQFKESATRFKKSEEEQTQPKVNALEKLLGLTEGNSALGKFITQLNKGFSGVDRGVETIANTGTDFLYRILFGGEDGKRGGAVIATSFLDLIQTHFRKFANFFDTKILSPMYDAMFGEKGFITKLQDTDFYRGFTEKKNKMKDMLSNFFFGKDDENGYKTGGLLSSVANELIDVGKSTKEFMFGKMGADGKMDRTGSVLGELQGGFRNITTSIKTAFGIKEDNRTFGEKVGDGLVFITDHMKKRATEWTDLIFGQKDEKESEGKSKLRDTYDTFMEDMEGKKGKIGAGAVMGAVGIPLLSSHLGLLGSLFLPGGPIGGAILGAGLAIASQSTGFKKFLFGDEVIDEDGKSQRTGGLITRQTQEFFKEHKTGISLGGLAGLIGSFGLIPGLFIPGGPIGGAIIGAGLSMVTKSQAFSDFLYGADGDKDNVTGGITKKIQDTLGKNKNLKSTAVDAGVGAGFGLLGSFFLPGGPITGALLGAAANIAINTDRFKNFLFGEEFTDENGKVKRKGGLITTVSDYVKGIFAPIAQSFKNAQGKFQDWIFENISLPLQTGLHIIGKRANEMLFGTKDKDGILHGGLFAPVRDALSVAVKPLKKALTKLAEQTTSIFKRFFGGIAKIFGAIISAPFKMIESVGRGIYDNRRKNAPKEERESIWKNGDMSFGQKLWASIRTLPVVGGKNREAIKNERTSQYVNGHNSVDEYQNELRAKHYGNRKDTSIKRGTSRSGQDWSADEDALVKRYWKKKKTGIPELLEAGRSEQEIRNRAAQLGLVSMLGLFNRRRNAHGADESSVDTTGDTIVKIAESSDNTEDYTRSSSDSLHDIKGILYDIMDHFRPGYKDKAVQNDYSKRSYETRASKNTTDGTYASESVESENGVDVSASGKANRTKISSDQSKSNPKKKSITSYLSSIDKNILKIKDSVDGQLNGVGYNVDKIYKMMKGDRGITGDDDIGGNNKKRHNTILGKIKSFALAPFRLVHNIGSHILSTIVGFGKAVKDTVGTVISGLFDIGSSIVHAVIDIPVTMFKIFGTVVKSIIPLIGSVLTTAVDAVGATIRVAGETLVSVISGLGTLLSNAAQGFGEMIGAAFSGLGNLLYGIGAFSKGALIATGKVIGGVGKAVGSIVGGVGRAAGNAIGGLFGRESGDGGNYWGDGLTHVYVEGGILDEVKEVDYVDKDDPTCQDRMYDQKDRMYDQLLNIESAILGKPRKSSVKDQFLKHTKITSEIDKDAQEELETKKSENGEHDTTISTDFNGIRNTIEEENKAKAEDEEKAQRLSLITRIANATEQQHTSWLSIFGKKGKIAALLLLGLPIIAAAFNKDGIFSGLKEMIGGVGSLLSTLSPIVEKIAEFFGIDTDNSSTAIKIDEKTGTAILDENGKTISDPDKDPNLLTKAANVLTPKTTRVDTSNGQLYTSREWNNMTEAKLVAGGTALRNGAKTVNKITNSTPVKFAGKVVKNSKLGHGVQAGAKTVKDGLGVAASKLTESKSILGNESAIISKLVSTGSSKADAVKIVSSIDVNNADDVAKAIAGNLSGNSKGVVNTLKSAGWATKDAKAYVSTIANNIDDVDNIAEVLQSSGSLTKTGAIGTAVNKLKDAKSAVKGASSGALSWIGGKLSAVKKIITGLIDNIVSGIKDFVTKKMKIKIPDSISTIVDKFKGHLDDIAQKAVTERGDDLAKAGAKDVAGTGTLGVSDAVFGVLGALGGATQPGYLFEVDTSTLPSDIINKMRLISALFKGILNVGKAGYFDLADSIFEGITGTSVVKLLAQALLKAWLNDEDDAMVKDSQNVLTSEWKDYVQQEYDAYVANCEETGQQAMSQDEFNSSVATSKANFNNNKNASIYKKAWDGTVGAVSKAGAHIKRGFSQVGGAVSGWWGGVTQKGSDLIQGASTSISNMKDNLAKVWDNSGLSKFVTSLTGVFPFLGSLVSDNVRQALSGDSESEITIDNADSLAPIKKVAAVGTKVLLLPLTIPIRIGRTLWDAVKSVASGVANIASSVWNTTKDVVGSALRGEYYEPTITAEGPLATLEQFGALAANFLLTPLRVTSQLVQGAWNGVKSVAGGIANVATDIFTVGRDALSASLRGECYDPQIEDTGVVGMMKSLGVNGINALLFPIRGLASIGKFVGPAFSSFFDGIGDIVGKISEYSKIPTDGKLSFSDFFKPPAGDGPTGMLDKILFYAVRGFMLIPFTLSKIFSGVTNLIGDVVSGLSDGANWILEKLGLGSSYETIDSSKDTVVAGEGGGFGEPTQVNGFPYYSQNDPSLKNQTYNLSNGQKDTIGNRGCGPVAMSMVASKLLGGNGNPYNPENMATAASMGGYSTDVGTTGDYFGAMGSSLGLGVSQSNTSENNIRNSLNAGQPVILQGASGDGNTPYTPQGHYVVGVGMQGNKVLVNDPRGVQYSKPYDLKDVTKGSGGMWSFLGGNGLNKRIRSKLGGRGQVEGALDVTTRSPNSTSNSNSSQAAEQAVVAAMKSIEGKLTYSKTNRSNANIDSVFTTGTGSGDCSSTVRWALMTGANVDPGANSSAQMISSNGVDVDVNSGGQPNEANLRPGDLLFFGTNGNASHVEMYIGNGKLMGHGGGSSGTQMGPIEKDMASRVQWGNNNGAPYIKARRFINASSVANTSIASSVGPTTSISSTGAVSSSDSGSSDSSSIGGMLSGLISNITKTATNWLFGTTDDATTTGSTTSGVNGAAVSAANISATEAAEKTWKFLRNNGIGPFGAAALMGNLYAESGIQPNNLQNSGNQSTGMSDEQYTAAVDNGTYGNFAGDSIGYGLAQWTSAGRKQGLLDLARSRGTSISDINTQLDWLYQELNTGYKANVLDQIANAQDISSASNAVLMKFESPADQGPSVQSYRASLAQGYYNQYKDIPLSDTPAATTNGISYTGNASKDVTGDMATGQQQGLGGMGYGNSRATGIKQSNIYHSGGMGSGNTKSAKTFGGWGGEVTPATATPSLESTITGSSLTASEMTTTTDNPVEKILVATYNLLSQIYKEATGINTGVAGLGKLGYTDNSSTAYNTVNNGTVTSPNVVTTSTDNGTNDRSEYPIAKQLANGIVLS